MIYGLSDIENSLLLKALDDHLKYKDDEITIPSINNAIELLKDALDEAIKIRDQIKELK